jgi:uncharacterized protein
MLNSKNTSRKNIKDWFVEFTGDKNVKLGEGGFVDAYDEDGKQNLLQTKKDHFQFRRISFNDIYSTNGKIGFSNIISKINNFCKDVLNQKPSYSVGQKCGMDNENTISIDLKGNVITCQNVSAVEISKNGQPHLSGNISDISNVKITTTTHWSSRNECPKCPVLHLCKGACMFLEGDLWKHSCDNAYSDNVALFALAIEQLTGYILTRIEQDDLSLDRQDVWGNLFEHAEIKRKTIPIKVVSSLSNENGIGVYSQSKII